MKKELTEKIQVTLFKTLKDRFEKNKDRHQGIAWEKIQDRLDANPEKVWSLNEMEETGGEPDVVGYDKKTDKYIFYDCAVQSPKGRRSICYDYEALASRKEHKPRHSAVGMAAEMGVSLLTEEEYRKLQQSGAFDTKTSSWLTTPDDVREQGGAIFGDRRFGRVFVYHNGAESYYAARGFRASLRI